MPSSRCELCLRGGRAAASRRACHSGEIKLWGSADRAPPGLDVQCALAPDATPCAWVSPSLIFEASSLARVLRPTARGSPPLARAGRVNYRRLAQARCGHAAAAGG